MFIAKVIGKVVSTQKETSLTGYKLLVVQRIDIRLNSLENELVAADYVGAGQGDYVLVGTGSAVRTQSRNQNSCIDAAVVGIIDSIDIDKEG